MPVSRRSRLYIETLHVMINAHGYPGCFWCRFGIQEPLRSPCVAFSVKRRPLCVKRCPLYVRCKLAHVPRCTPSRTFSVVLIQQSHDLYCSGITCSLIPYVITQVTWVGSRRAHELIFRRRRAGGLSEVNICRVSTTNREGLGPAL